MTFKEFLQANRLPPVGATLMMPDGSKVVLVGYEFYDDDKEWAVIKCEGGAEIYWTFRQVERCDWWKKDKEDIV